MWSVIVCLFQAMNLLYLLQNEEVSSLENRRRSPLRAWLATHGHHSLAKFSQFMTAGPHQPLVFQAETPLRQFVAYIDLEDRFSIQDKLSQVSWPNHSTAWLGSFLSNHRIKFLVYGLSFSLVSTNSSRVRSQYFLTALRKTILSMNQKVNCIRSFLIIFLL